MARDKSYNPRFKDYSDKEIEALIATKALQKLLVIGGVNHVLNRVAPASGKLAKIGIFVTALAVANHLTSDEEELAKEFAHRFIRRKYERGEEADTETTADSEGAEV